jgi:hypothetical protein
LPPASARSNVANLVSGWNERASNVAIWEMSGTTILDQATSFVANVAGSWSIQDPERN